MLIRLVKPTDYESIATVSVNSHTDDVQTAFLYPGREAHPDIYRRHALKHAKHHAMIPQCFVVVAEAESGEIAGYCLWVRDSKDEATKRRWGWKESPLQSEQPRRSVFKSLEADSSERRRRICSSMAAYYISVLHNPAASLRNSFFGWNEDDELDDPSFDNDPPEC